MSGRVDTARTPGLFSGLYVWSGIAMALGGFLAEEATGGVHGFEFLMFFGGFNLGSGLMQNRFVRRAGGSEQGA